MRKIASVILLVTFIILSVSGVQMATVPKPQAVQRPAGSPDTDKSTAKREMPFYPKRAHEVAGYLFIGAGAVHLILNKRAMLSYLRIKKNT